LLFGPAVSGRTFGQGTCGTYNPANPTKTLCDLTTFHPPVLQPSLSDFRNFKSSDLYNRRRYAKLQAPVKDVSVYAQGHFDIFDNVTFTANAAYVRDEATQRLSADGIGIGLTSAKTANGKKIGIDKTNPYNPFGVDLVASSTDPCLAAGTCIGLSKIRRWPIELGPRVSDFNRDYFHIFTGFNGYVNLFNREIDWDVSFAQNRVQTATLVDGRINLAHLARALGSVSQCTSPCVPLNFLGGAIKGVGGSITPAQADYVTYEPHNVDQSNLRDWTADLSSDLYDLPAGPLGLAIGYERIDNYGYSHPDSVVVEGNDNDGAGNLLNGRVVRDAEYAELNIPLLADLPGVRSLSVDIANRWTQFKRSGGIQGQASAETFVHNSSGRLNIRYQVINDLLLRASWSQGFRSPNVSELFGGIHRAHFTSVHDPCAGPPKGGHLSGPLPPNCPNGIATTQQSYGINGISGSNPKLEPESSLSRTAGFVYSPSQVPGLDVNADYFKIELTDAVGTVGAQSILNGCFFNRSFCNLITVTAQQVSSIRNVSTNVGSLLTEGIDVGLHYKFPATPIGDFDARIDGTFLKVFDQTKVNLATKTGFATSHLAGVEPQPKRRFNGYLDWDYGNWSAQYHLEYIGDSVGQCGIGLQGYCTYPNRTTDFQGTPGRFGLGRQHFGATVYHDVHVGYTVPSINTTFAVGVNNLFDKQPPIPGVKYPDWGFYRLPSRFLYGSIRVRF
jgi:iron complex outermembrane receptor protein